jgi:hypothetical protein
MLPKPNKKKIIKLEEFVKNAKKARESYEEQAKYEYEKKSKDGNCLSPNTYYFS